MPPPVDPEILRTHAANLEMLAYRARSVGYVSAGAVLGADAYGRLCSPIVEELAELHRDQDDLTERLSENLEVVMRMLCATADARPTGNRERRADYWAPARRSRQPEGLEDGVDSQPLGEVDFDGLVEWCRNRSWIDERLTGIEGRDADPHEGAFIRPGESAAESTPPLFSPLSKLIGLLDVDFKAVSDACRYWGRIATELRAIATDLEWHLEVDLDGWVGADRVAYLTLMAGNVSGTVKLGYIAEGLGHMVEGVAFAVRATRGAIGLLLAQMVNRAAGLTSGVDAAQGSVETIGDFLQVVMRNLLLAMGYLQALAQSLENLRTLLRS